MNIPKWLVSLWAIETILVAIICPLPGTAFDPTQTVGELFLISGLFFLATGLTVIWFLGTKRATAVQKFYVILWIVAVFVAKALSNLRPAAAGAKSSVSSVGPPVTLAVAGAIMLTVWGVRRFHKPRAV